MDDAIALVGDQSFALHPMSPDVLEEFVFHALKRLRHGCRHVQHTLQQQPSLMFLNILELSDRSHVQPAIHHSTVMPPKVIVSQNAGVLGPIKSNHDNIEFLSDQVNTDCKRTVSGL
jgi:hypothetical protein